MSNHDRRSEWTVLVGNRARRARHLAVPRTLRSRRLVAPLAAMFDCRLAVGWPLVLDRHRRAAHPACSWWWMDAERTEALPLAQRPDDRRCARRVREVRWASTRRLLRVVYAILTLFTGFWSGILVYIAGDDHRARGAVPGGRATRHAAPQPRRRACAAARQRRRSPQPALRAAPAPPAPPPERAEPPAVPPAPPEAPPVPPARRPCSRHAGGAAHGSRD